MSKFLNALLIAGLTFSLMGHGQAQVVKNAYYSLDLGSEWEQPNGEKIVDNNYSTVFTNKAHDTVIYLAINEAKITSELIAQNTAEQMRATGAIVQALQGSGDLHFFDYSIQNKNGRYFFKETPHGYTAVSLYGDNINEAQHFIKQIRPYGELIIPQ